MEQRPNIGGFMGRWNNKGIIFLGIGIFLWWILCPNKASGGTYLDSAHGNSTSGVNRSHLDAQYSTFATGNCAHCHEQKASLGGAEPAPSTGVDAGPDNYLLFGEWSSKYYENRFCNKCHDGSTNADNIATLYTKTYTHTPSMVSCIDCHEPHIAQNTTHNAASDGNTASGAIKGIGGVEPTFSSPGTPPAGSETLSTPSYTEVEPVTKEYQLCLKCHSSYSYGGTPPGDWTDQGKEFNPNNYCFHPVTGTAGVTQWKNPTIRNNYTTVLKAPWNANLDARMYCSDCHGSDTSTDPKGPHGSNAKYILKAWGGVYNSGTINTNAAYSYDALCLLCHSDKYWGDAGGSPGPWPHTQQPSRHCYDGETTGSGSTTVSYDNVLGCRACHCGPAGFADFDYDPSYETSNGGRAGAIHGENFYWDNPGTEPNNPADHFLLGGYNVGLRLDEYSGGTDGDGKCWSAGFGKNASPCGSMTGGKKW